MSASSGTISGQVDLSWGGFSDATSGLASYLVVYRTGSAPASKCTSGTAAYEGSGTTVSVTGLSDGTTYYFRVCAVDAAGNVSGGLTTTAIPRAETNPPAGTVTINGGATYATATAVTLSFAASDDTGVTELCISSSTSCSAWQTYTTTRAWSMSGNGLKTVYVYFRDASRNVSSVASASIVVDTGRPTNPTVSAAPSNAQVALSWTAATDTTSGVGSYKVVRGSSSLTSCSVGTPVYCGAELSFVDTGLSNGDPVYYRVCAVDNAGNMGTGTALSATPASEFDPPENTSVEIEAGAAWTTTTSVTLALSAEDASGLARMCISNNSTCTSWQSFAPTKSWILGTTGTTRTVYAWFKDVNGNVTTAAATDSIGVDSARPTDGTVSAEAGAVSLAVSWAGFVDGLSGITSYKVVYQEASSAPGTCNVGTVAYVGTATDMTLSGLEDGTWYGLRVCATDAAGNVSAGTSLIVQTIADDEPPTGTVTLSDGLSTTNALVVPISLDFYDERSGIARVCLSAQADTCSDWQSYAPTLTWTLDATDGEQRVYVWAEDGAGNVTTEPVSDSVVLDQTAPVDGSVNASFDDDDTVAASWSGFTDSLSGLVGYVVAYNLDGSDPEACATADVTLSTGATTTALDGLDNTLSYTVRVCGVDAAGNLSWGSTGFAPCTGYTFYLDADGDGHGGETSVAACVPPEGYVATGGDCDDTRAEVSPVGVEVCDHLDNDCNTVLDDVADPPVWYRDADADSFGDASVAWAICDQPAGYVANTEDCDDSSSAVTIPPTFYADVDADGFGATEDSMEACTLPAGYSAADGDCDDADDAVYPGALDAPFNGVDDDCDAHNNAVVEVAAGATHSLFLASDGTVWASGSNDYGQLGDGTNTSRTTPTQIPGLSDVVSIAVGSYHSLAVLADGTARAWGYNLYGRLGDGTTTTRRSPVVVSGLSGVVQVAAGNCYSVALLSSGAVRAWGCNGEGQVGDGTTTTRTTATAVSGLSSVVAISVRLYHALALSADGRVYAWGKNTNSQLGDGSTTNRTTPVLVPGLPTIAQISAGDAHSLAVGSDGSLWAWGYNLNSRLGDGTTTTRSTPISLSGLSGVVAAAAGAAHSLALRSDGGVWAWGSNAQGQLGDGSLTSRSTPTPLTGISDVAAISAGNNHSLAITEAGRAWAWGANTSGVLGLTGTSRATSPTQLSTP